MALLADATLAAVRELLFFLPFGALAEAAWAYDGWVFGQSGARWPGMNVVGSGYFPSRNALASQGSEGSEGSLYRFCRRCTFRRL